MIYTTHEIINRSAAGTGPNSRPGGQNAEGRDLWNGAELGIKWAPMEHNMPYFRRRQSGPRGRNALFSRRILQSGVGADARRARQYK
jgi:hypothetical protein